MSNFKTRSKQLLPAKEKTPYQQLKQENANLLTALANAQGSFEAIAEFIDDELLDEAEESARKGLVAAKAAQGDRRIEERRKEKSTMQQVQQAKALGVTETRRIGQDRRKSEAIQMLRQWNLVDDDGNAVNDDTAPFKCASAGEAAINFLSSMNLRVVEDES